MKTALITGASSGLGLEFAKLFAADGYHLVLVARRGDKLEALAAELQAKHDAIRILCIPKDLTEPQAPVELTKKLEQVGITVDVLVNNAGFAQYGYFHQTSLRRQLDLIQLNISALTELTHLLLKDMIAKKQGRILNVASTAAFQPGPLMSVYYASKAYVLHFSEGLRNELKGTGVTVTALCPGATATEFQNEAAIPKVVIFSKCWVSSPEKVARAGYKGLMKNRGIVIPGLLNKTLAFLTRVGPRSINVAVARILQVKH